MHRRRQVVILTPVSFGQNPSGSFGASFGAYPAHAYDIADNIIISLVVEKDIIWF